MKCLYMTKSIALRILFTMAFTALPWRSYAQNALDSELINAVRVGDVKAVAGLLKRGASLEAKDDIDGNPVINIAVEEVGGIYEGDHLGTIKYLLDHGARLDSRGKNDWTPLHVAAVSGRNENQDADQIAAVALLLERGARVDATDKFKKTPLHLAAMSCYTDEALLLIKKGADINARDIDGKTPMQTVGQLAPCTPKMKPKMIKLLGQYGAK
jgi:ankyrin repeat protein